MKVYEDEEDSYWIRVKDKDGKCWKIQVDKIKYPELRKDEIIRIKSGRGNLINGENVLELRAHTNILKFIKDSKLVKSLFKNINDNDIDRVIRDKEEPLNELIITKEQKSHKYLKKATLLQIYFPREHKITEGKENVSLNEDEMKSDESSELYNSRVRKSIDFDDQMGDDKRYVVDFTILWYEPQDVREFVKAYCNS